MTSVVDTILEKYNLQDKKLSEDEKQTLYTLVKEVQSKELTVEKFHDKVVVLRNQIMSELIKEPEFNYIFIFKVPNRNQILLKARLENMMLLEAILTDPKKAKMIFEAQTGLKYQV